MTAAQAPVERFTISLPVGADELAKYAGLIGLASAILAAAGIFSTAAYLTAWNIPAPVLRMDPLTAATRSETVVVQVLTLWALVYGIDALRHRLAPWPRARVAVFAGIGFVLVALLANAVVNGFASPVLTIAGGIALLGAHWRRLVSAKTTLVLFAALAIAGAYEIGRESGRLIRDDAMYQTPLELTTRTELGGLPGAEVGFGWRYDGLYLVFRDGESVYVARNGDDRVWIVPAANVMAVGIARR